MTIRILGLDPSLTHTGWSVAEVCPIKREILDIIDAGTIITAPTKNKQVRASSDALFRARTVKGELYSIIDQHSVKLACSEIPSGAQSAKALYAFGIVVGLVASLPVPVLEVTPREVKLATVGKLTADKEDMVRWAVDLTYRVGGTKLWETGRKNDWEIEICSKHVLKAEEHKADSMCGIQAAISSEQFRQLAGMMAAVI